jgi:hypothetical protein
MKDIQEIVQLVALRGASELKANFEREDSTLYDQLLDGIKSGKFSNDEEATEALYGSKSAKVKFKTLKSRFKDLLLDNIILMKVDPRKQSPYNRLVHQSVKNFCSARLLLLNGASQSGITLMKKAYLLSDRAEITGLSVISLQWLALMSSVYGDRPNFARYKTRVLDTVKLYAAEIEAESIENDMRISLLKQIGFNKKLVDLLEFNFKRLTELVTEYSSTNVRWNYYRVGCFHYSYSGDYEKLLSLTQEAEVFNKSNKELYSLGRGGELSLMQITSYLQLKEYQAGVECAEKCKIYFIKGTYNWFVYSENYFLFELNIRNYERALDIFNEAMRHPRMKTMPPDRKEKWKIYEAYLYYMLPPVLRPHNFKVLRFLNEVPLYSRDKAGFNVAINIIQILLMIKERQFDKLIDKAESLKMYRSRYIKEDEDFRSNCFVKMLLIMIRCDFDPEMTKREAGTYFKKMESYGEKSGRHFDAMEVVPYEVLWENVMEDIQNYSPQNK